ncbi:MAG: glycosyltransferase [Verrucomicrobia bacterium]|nr:glycosyltransferase [Verrucomicrobiota bacterium]MBV8485757.1 glycosyltransferase [Verrucomicrobiota bacterium]
MKIVVLGLSITSSWGNGHATTYRSLISALHGLGHEITFLERDMPWYASHRDAAMLPFCQIELYHDLSDLEDRFSGLVRSADVAVVGSYVPDGVMVGEWVTRLAEGITAFYDIDTPVTLAKLEQQDYEYLAPFLIPKFQVYFSFAGGPVLNYLQERYGSPKACPLYCCADIAHYYPESVPQRWLAGYLGTYSSDRQKGVEEFLMNPARLLTRERFVVAGPSYPDDVYWPPNVERIDHLSPDKHRQFYCAQKFTINITRADMRRRGYSPSVRLFEAAACGVPIMSDFWEGIERFFEPGKEILLVHDTAEVMKIIRGLTERERRKLAFRARVRVLKDHTATQRARELLSALEGAESGQKSFNLG